MDGVKIEALTENEGEIIRSTLTILLDRDNQVPVVEKLLDLCPEVAETFSSMPNLQIQSAFLLNMYKRGVNLMCNEKHQEVFEIFERHPKYNVTIPHVETANKCVLEVMMDFLENKNMENIDYGAENSEIERVWTKLQNNFIEIMRGAYKKESSKTQISDKKAAKNRQRVFRLVTVKDIENVTKAWEQISKQKDESATKLVKLLSTERQILKVFHDKNIDVVKQAETIFDMISTVVNQLTDVDNLIPYLKNLGAKHAQMNIAPRTLALMKSILMLLFKQCLGFHFTDELKESWQRIIGFIIGMMMEGCRRNNDKCSTASSFGGADNESMFNSSLSQSDIETVSESWTKVQKVLDVAVTSFYKDLISSKAEVRNLFSKSDMAAQANKLVRAVGSVIALLHNLEDLIPVLEELGRRHVYYNVRPKHFKYLKLAWFNMLKNSLGIQWNDSLSKSWSRIWKYITTIMKASLEDAWLLYTPPDPEKVKVKILINHIDKIETQNMSFWTDIWYAAFTNENPSQSAAFGAEAINHEKKYENGIYDERPAWNLVPLTAMETDEMYTSNDDKWSRKYTNGASDGKDQWYTRGNIKGTFNQDFDLHSFPFDHHNIIMKFALQIDESVATFANEEDLNVRLMPFKLDMMGGTDWDVFTPNIYIKKESAIEGGSASGKRYTHCVIEIPVARRYAYHIWNTFIPLLLIEIFAFSIYFCATRPLAKRLSVIATLLLTLFTFKITVSESMPPTPYVTLLDYFFHRAKLLLLLHVLAQ
eukprot:25609_1